MASFICCVSQDSLLNINFPLWLLNPSKSQVFLELVDMKMKIDSSTHLGLSNSTSAELSPFDILERYSSFP
ncbi:hypothetical protein DPMN_175088 [Dreissena polymorpha]|uniref:Uncharacterized protein n=1 Tax=Dreissena polymorpha TaxID=45954 RepID=A0A9D4IGY8_DREPO|nr:hypothetical protein DPMN_175088 [Dreissena polymorpha]